MAPPAVTPQIYIGQVISHPVREKWKGRGAHVAKVTRENVKGHCRSSLGDWYGRQDREERGDVNDANPTTDDNLETDRLGKTAVRTECRQKTCPDDGEHPTNVHRDRVIARLLDCDARHNRDEADGIRQPKKVDTGSRGRFVLARFKEDREPI